MSEFSKQSSDALGVFSEFLTNFAAYKCSDFAQKFQNMNSFVSLSRESFAFGRFWSWLCFLRLVLLMLDNFGHSCWSRALWVR